MHSIPVLAILEKLGIIIEGDAKDVLDILEKEGIVNENYVADKLGIRINDVRKALYKLGNYGFVTYTKEKDEDKKWWYVYNWQLDTAKIHYKYVQHIKAILHEKEAQLADEQQYAFQCRRCKKKYTYDSALERDFVCDDCTGIVKEVTNSRVISGLTKDIAELLAEIKIEDELIRKHQSGQKKARDILHEKEDAIEAEIKSKKLADARAKRAAAREVAKKAKEKANPKKKPVKKKPTKKKLAKKSSKKVVKKPVKKKVASKKKPVKKKPTKKRR
ncbi:hypothetical protein HOD83_01070 [Candidatus Woesearchaeota archaeon]|jgi:transcription initiation factor TFIIE subunit alpha|nr:hypothetical protein [Candidatus Woesearchaeota archaeon]MBT4114708.1 hypothetical protein [Candidatus Woesearchaeota archaeon]MBT4248164.1 hypothetical protein [Candidatus Woesearchaeota archaeon]